MSSVTFYKYCGNGFGEERPLEVGQKQAIVKVARKGTVALRLGKPPNPEDNPLNNVSELGVG